MSCLLLVSDALPALLRPLSLPQAATVRSDKNRDEAEYCFSHEDFSWWVFVLKACLSSVATTRRRREGLVVSQQRQIDSLARDGGSRSRPAPTSVVWSRQTETVTRRVLRRLKAIRARRTQQG